MEVHPDYKGLRSFIESLPMCFETTGTEIYNGRNILKKYEVDGLSLIVKRFRKPHLINRLVYGTFRDSKAKRSYTYSLKLNERDISTPAPVGYVEEFRFGLGYSYFVSLELQHAQELEEFYRQPEIKERRMILEEFGRFTAKLHESQILHKDYSARNVLFAQEKELTPPHFYLVDLNRMRFHHTVEEEEGYKNLERLQLSDEIYTIIAKAYASARGFDEKKAVERVLFYKNSYPKKRK